LLTWPASSSTAGETRGATFRPDFGPSRKVFRGDGVLFRPEPGWLPDARPAAERGLAVGHVRGPKNSGDHPIGLGELVAREGLLSRRGSQRDRRKARASRSALCARPKHDPEKCAAVFPRDKRGEFAPRSGVNKELKRGDESTSSHRALEPVPDGLPTRPIAGFPDVTAAARRTGAGNGGAFIPYPGARTPAIDHARARNRRMASGSATVCGSRRPDAGKCNR